MIDNKQYAESAATLNAAVSLITSLVAANRNPKQVTTVRRTDIEHKVASALNKRLTVYLPKGE